VTLIAGSSAVSTAAYLSQIVLGLADEVSPVHLFTDYGEAAVEVNDSWYLLEATTIDHSLAPHKSIVRAIEIMMLIYPESHSFLAAITLDVDEESIAARIIGATVTPSTKKSF
jgi:hypothetical protein